MAYSTRKGIFCLSPLSLLTTDVWLWDGDCDVYSLIRDDEYGGAFTGDSGDDDDA